MDIEAYSRIKAVVDRYAVAPFVISASVAFESRPAEQGFLSGTIQFADGSELHFREYLDAQGDAVEKVMYSYHFQDEAQQLILRYDNAAHRSGLVSLEHKHGATGISATIAPRLEDVLSEIAELRHWV